MADKNQTNQENEKTLPDSSSEQKTPDKSEKGVSSDSPKEPELSEEELKKYATSKLQQRVIELVKERDEWQKKAQVQVERDQQQLQQPVYQQPETTDDEVSKAVETLVGRGIATKKEVTDLIEQKLGDAFSRLRTDALHDQLESKYNGSDGLPKYDRTEIEDYARKTRNFDLEAAYKNLYFDEFMDQAARQKQTATHSTSSERPTAKVDQEVLTLEKFREKLRGADGLKYYDKLAKNPNLFDNILKDLAPQE